MRTPKLLIVLLSTIILLSPASSGQNPAPETQRRQAIPGLPKPKPSLPTPPKPGLPDLKGPTIPTPDIPASSVEEVMKSLKAEMPFLADLPTDLKAEVDGFYYARDLSFAGGTLTVVVYHPQRSESGRLDVALMMKDYSIGTILKGLGDTPFEQLKMDHPVIFYAPKIKEDAVDVVTTARLPRIVAEYVKVSANEVYLRRGLNLTCKLDPQQSLGDAVDMLKNIGVDLSDLVLQGSFTGGKNIFLRRKGEWKNPFQLRDSSITDATLYIRATTTSKTLAAWGQAKIGSTKAFLYAERVTAQGKPIGEAYGLNAKTLTLQAITDVMKALPLDPQPFPLVGLEALPMDKIVLKNPNFKEDYPGREGLPRFEDCMVFIGTTPAVSTPDGKYKGPCLYANGQASILGYNAASLQVTADSSQLVAWARIESPKFGGFSFGWAIFQLLNTSTQHQASFSGSLGGTVGGVNLNQGVEIDVSNLKYKFSTKCNVGPVIGATATFTSMDNYAFPWDVSVDVTGVAGKLFDTGMEAYATARDVLDKAGVKLVEPNDVRVAAAHVAGLTNAQKWNDLADDVAKNLTSPSDWDKAARDLPLGQAFRNPESTVTTVTSAAREKIVDATAIAMDAGSGAKSFFENVGSGFKSVGKLFGRGGKKKAKPVDLAKIIADVFNTKKVMWNGRERRNEATWIGLGYASSMASKDTKYLNDGKDNPPYSSEVTSLTTQVQNLPWIQLDLQTAYPIESIIIQTPDDVMPDGLKGAIVALGRHRNETLPNGKYFNEGDDVLMEPGKVPQFYITQKGSMTVIEPSMGKKGYRDLRRAVEAAASKLGEASEAEKPQLQKEYEAAQKKLMEATDCYRHIRVFLPGKGRLAISEIRVLSVPQVGDVGLFQNLPVPDSEQK